MGNGDVIRVKHESMDFMADAVSRNAKQNTSAIEELLANLRPLEEGFRGQALEAFRELETLHRTESGKMQALLQRQGTHVNESGEAYNAADLKGAGLFM